MRAGKASGPPLRIEIFGGIASGKTTLAGVLARRTHLTLVRERFRQNPFWARFYADPDRFVREKNIAFLALHTGAIRSQTGVKAMVCDYAVFQDLAYARLSKSPSHRAAMEATYRDLYGSLNPPELFIYLQCAPRVQLERIRARHRREEAAITVGYLRSLNDSIEAMIKTRTHGSKFHLIRSDRVDFAHDRGEAARVKSEIIGMIGEPLD